MKSFVKKPLAKIWRAVIEFDMIKENDHILIGFSGGKDSIFMLWALAELRSYAPFAFDISAFTVDLGFSKDFPAKKLASFCSQFDIKYYHEQVQINKIIEQTDKSPCYTCSYFRRGATARMAKQITANKIALAHHGDDAVETFFMNITTSGQLKTFLPVTWLSRQELHVIRPLLYYREKEIEQYVQQFGFQPFKNPCPHDGKTMRQKVKEQIKQLENISPKLYDNLFTAMRQANNMELWPEKLNKQQNMETFHQFWRKHF